MSLTYTHNLVFGGWSTIHPVAWSREVDVQFHLIAPFSARIFCVRNGALRRALLVLLILAAALISERIR